MLHVAVTFSQWQRVTLVVNSECPAEPCGAGGLAEEMMAVILHHILHSNTYIGPMWKAVLSSAIACIAWSVLGQCMVRGKLLVNLSIFIVPLTPIGRRDMLN